MDHTEAATTDRELILTRVLDAPRELVFRMWTRCRNTSRNGGDRWVSPIPCGKWDVRPGGELRIVMRAPDGTDYPMIGTFREVVSPERLVFTNSAVDVQGNVLLDGITVVTFTERGGKTELTVQTHAIRAGAARRSDARRDGCRVASNPRSPGRAIVREESASDNRRIGSWLLPHHRCARASGCFRPGPIRSRSDFGGARRALRRHRSKWIFARVAAPIRSCMRSPKGRFHCPAGCLIAKLSRPERIVFTFGLGGRLGRISATRPLVTVTFADQAGKTLLPCIRPPSKASRGATTTGAAGRVAWSGSPKYLASA